MEVAKVYVHGSEAELLYAKPITTGMIGSTVAFELDANWTNLVVAAVFKAGGRILDAVFDEDKTIIPYELLFKAGGFLHVGLQGIDSDANVVIPTVWVCLGRILEGANPSGQPGTTPGVDNPLWMQVSSQLTKHIQDNNNPHKVDGEDVGLTEALEVALKKAKDSGLYDGATYTPSVSEDGVLSWSNDKSLPNPDAVNITGPSGATYTPSVSEDGVLSWSNDKSLPNPDAVNITGPSGATYTPSVSEDGVLSWSNDKSLPNPDAINLTGPAGHTPVKGEDYFTPEDKAEIVTAVLEALPVWEGGIF